MKKKNFYSTFYRKEIITDDIDYWYKVYSELLYRIETIRSSNCTCFQCQTDLEKYLTALEKVKKEVIKITG